MVAKNPSNVQVHVNSKQVIFYYEDRDEIVIATRGRRMASGTSNPNRGSLDSSARRGRQQRI